MNITVKLFATLRNDRFQTKVINCNDGISVRNLLDLIKLDEKEVAIIFHNGRHAKSDDILSENDTVAFFPPIGGG